MKKSNICLFVVSLALAACGPLEGEKGQDGLNGGSCSVLDSSEGAVIQCEDGTRQVIKDGRQGLQGAAGESCSIEPSANGAVITCGGNSVEVLNGVAGSQGEKGEQGVAGKDGADGKDGIDGVLKTIDPCPTMDADFKEILLVTSSGLVAYFKNGTAEHLTHVPVDMWLQTSDSRKCKFMVKVQDGQFVIVN